MPAAEREFHYVVVGAGSAGCTLARLLATGQSRSVAVIEAGAAVSDVRSVVPNYYPRCFGSALDWNFATVPQPQLGDRRIAWPRGKVVGGSGAINALIFMLAADADFAAWGWPIPAASADPWPTTPYAANTAAANLAAANLAAADLSRGPLSSPHVWSEAFLEAATALGLERQHTWKKASANSCGYFQLTQRHGRRCHAGHWLISEAAGELSSLTLIPQATVRRVILHQQRAVGVELRTSAGSLETIRATGEIILCGGAIGSPCLLQASGIGPAELLQAQGVRCVHPLPAVGENLQDHLVYPLIYQTHQAIGLPRRHSPAQRQGYRQAGSGPLASNIAEAGGLVKFDDPPGASPDACRPTDLQQPDFQIHFTPTHYLKYPRLPSGDHFLSLAVCDLHPRSRGRVRLAAAGGVGSSNEWNVHIDPHYLQAADDGQRLLRAIAWTRQLAQQPGLREVIAGEALPGPRRSDDRAVLRSVQAFAQSIYHPVGTCRMQPVDAADGADSVVDQAFRVHGLSGLRVVDASVLPSLPSCNTNAVTLWLAAWASQKILGQQMPAPHIL